MMKKYLAVLLAVCLLLGLCACAGGTEETTEGAKGVSFTFTVIHDDSTEKTFDLCANEGESLADVLARKGLAEESTESAGFYDVFDGEKADWNDGEAWWNILCNGESVMVGIQELTPAEGDAYSAVFTRGFAE